MTASDPPALIADEELLARFILFSKWVRSSDQTIKSDAFTPFPFPDLSVTRHTGLTEEKIWEKGNDVANERAKTLYGRADASTANVRKHDLNVIADPIPDKNMNHANITGWPQDKPSQKIIAQLIAAEANYVAKY